MILLFGDCSLGIAQTLLTTSPIFIIPIAVQMGEKISVRGCLKRDRGVANYAKRRTMRRIMAIFLRWRQQWLNQLKLFISQITRIYFTHCSERLDKGVTEQWLILTSLI